jgi:hypothetical protein
MTFIKEFALAQLDIAVAIAGARANSATICAEFCRGARLSNGGSNVTSLISSLHCVVEKSAGKGIAQ